MPKNIVVLSDGTGQEGGKTALRNTNVYRMFRLLEDRTPRQVVFYDPGLGTGWRKITGNIAGAGLTRNILEAYRFIFERYEAGDRIYLVGFSRGAATVRSLAGFINHFGILPRSRPDLIKKAYRIYKTRSPMSRWWARRRVERYPIRFARTPRWRRWLRRVSLRADDYGSLTDPRTLIDLDLRLPVADEIARIERMYLHVVDVDGDGRLTPQEFQTAITGPLMARVEDLAARVERSATWASRFLRSRTVVGPDGDLRLHEGVEPRQVLRTLELEMRARRFLEANYSHRPRIEFVGCFDTVAALGLPSPLLDSIVNRIPGMAHKFHDFDLPQCVDHAYHALAIDDKRKPFQPLLWTSPNGDATAELVESAVTMRVRDLTQQFVDAGRRLEVVLGHDPDDWNLFAPVVAALAGDGTDAAEEPEQTVEQVWFTGMHTDVGGGYEERGLADITLAWMLRHGLEHGMLLYRAPRLAPDPVGLMHDSRGRWVTRLIYPRRVDRAVDEGVTPVIDSSVVVRSRATKVAVWKRGRAVFVPPRDYPQPLTQRATIRTSNGAGLDDLIETQEQRWQNWIAEERKEAAERRAAEVTSGGAGF